jgi:3-deoxy-D-manno-octulosonic acid kinase
MLSGGDFLSMNTHESSAPWFEEAVEKTSNGAILYDTAIIDQVSDKTFSAAGWKTVRRVDNVLRSGGRGHTLIIGDGKNDYVLRHFMRGGLIGRIIRDSYFWAGEEQTRSFMEWRLLHKLARMGLPVPRPAVARYCRRGATYTADIITCFVPGIRSLSIRLAEKSAGEHFWASLGARISRFHEAGVNHADLNAYNIQVDANDEITLLDFDRGSLLPPGAWQQKNLARLHRSLQKISRLDPRVNYTQDNWQQFLEGYFQASRSS